MADPTKAQIASMISDVRLESSYQTTNPEGGRSTVTLVEFPTVDDLMLQGMKSVAAEIKFANVSYSSIQQREMVTQLVRTQVPVTRAS